MYIVKCMLWCVNIQQTVRGVKVSLPQIVHTVGWLQSGILLTFTQVINHVQSKLWGGLYKLTSPHLFSWLLCPCCWLNYPFFSTKMLLVVLIDFSLHHPCLHLFKFLTALSGLPMASFTLSVLCAHIPMIWLMGSWGHYWIAKTLTAVWIAEHPHEQSLFIQIKV